jgi:hypothetical protein
MWPLRPAFAAAQEQTWSTEKDPPSLSGDKKLALILHNA